jgi:hypothetical protein
MLGFLVGAWWEVVEVALGSSRHFGRCPGRYGSVVRYRYREAWGDAFRRKVSLLDCILLVW